MSELPWVLAAKQRAHELRFARGDQTELAEALCRCLGGSRELVADEGAIYRYDRATGLYAQMTRYELSRVVQSFAGRPIGPPRKRGSQRQLNVNAATVRGVIELAEARRHVPDFFANAPPGVAFLNGFLRVSSAGLRLAKASPQHRARVGYDFDFLDHARPRAFIRFLRALFDRDHDTGQKIDALREFLGAMISGRATELQRACVLVGPGGTGKSTLQRIAAAIAPGPVAGLQPALFGDQYQVCRLRGARLNAPGDLTDDDLHPAIKSVISGEAISSREVGFGSFTFRPRAAHLFTANPPLPRTRDVSSGFFRRWLIIRCQHPVKDRVLDFADQLVERERDVIVAWALHGAVRALQQREFTLPLSHELSIAEWRGASDTVPLFVARACQPGSRKRSTAAADLYRAYEQWCTAFGADPVTQTIFGSRLKRLGVTRIKGSRCNSYPLTLLEP